MNDNIYLIFFVYGLAFFSMGLALLLESNRSPLLAEARVLRPLALFGLLHGMHEWYELYIMLNGGLAALYPTLIEWTRLVLLVVSFSMLLTFAMRVYFPSRSFWYPGLVIAIGCGLIYLLVLLADWRLDVHLPGDSMRHADSFARYLFGVTGAGLACLALFHQASLARAQGRNSVYKALLISSIGFGFYSLTQIFVPKANFFPANVLNSASFAAFMGFPIQLIRAGMAITITLGLIRAVQKVDEERLAQFESAQQARVLALEQVQIELKQRDELRRELLRQIVLAQEDERARIARELHDETSQVLAAFNLYLATLAEQLKMDEKSSNLVGQLKKLNLQMAGGIYRMVRDLRPAQLDDLGLVPAIEYLVREVKARTGLQANFTIHGEQHRLDSLIETVVFRVAQEGLTNIIRHAGVEKAELELVFSRDQVRLGVCDEGKGFDPSEVFYPPRGLGLAGMRERVEAVNGQLEIKSSPGKGCCLHIFIPLQNEEQPIQMDMNEADLHRT